MLQRTPNLDPEDFDITDMPASDERSMARRLVLQVLYEADAARHYPLAIMARHLEERQPISRIARYVSEVVQGISETQPDIDRVISRFAPEFPLDQIAVIDRNILRLAIFEFAVSQRTPVGAAIDEAVELAKLFGGDSSPAFINGVLGAIADAPDAIIELSSAKPSE
jgi:N utilization substance protein B